MLACYVNDILQLLSTRQERDEWEVSLQPLEPSVE